MCTIIVKFCCWVEIDLSTLCSLRIFWELFISGITTVDDWPNRGFIFFQVTEFFFNLLWLYFAFPTLALTGPISGPLIIYRFIYISFCYCNYSQFTPRTKSSSIDFHESSFFPCRLQVKKGLVLRSRNPEPTSFTIK